MQTGLAPRRIAVVAGTTALVAAGLLLPSSAGEWDVWATDLHNPDFAAYAELCGAQGIRVTQAKELDDALVEELDHDGPSLVEVVADPELI